MSDGDTDGVPLHFPCNGWFGTKVGASAVRRLVVGARLHLANYRITVVTGKCKAAEMQQSAHIQLAGGDGVTDVVELRTSLTNLQPFERGQTDEFIVSSNHLSDIDELNVYLNGEEEAISW